MAKRVLLVDDDADLLAALRVVLEAEGYEVATATNGAEGWQAARESPPDLAVVDAMIDTFSEGVHLACRLRSDADLKAMPIIMVTAVNDELPYRLDGRGGPGGPCADRFMERPVDPSELLSAMAELLRS
ncbi:MAG: response regulator [Candidatus Brocadiaceae bacterium]|nr:response regulator [Candidatus Brocadiaceae bacterium]